MYQNLPSSHQDTEQDVIGHMSPAEIEALSAAQGGLEMDQQRGMPSFARLLEILKHPACAQVLHDLERQAFAHGGEVDILNAHLRKNGRMGDTMTAVIPRPLANWFDRVLNGGKPSINPHTNKREYWFGGSFMNSISDALSPLVKPIQAVGDFLTPAATAVTPLIGGAMKAAAPVLGTAAQAALTGLATRYGGGPGGAAAAAAMGDAIKGGMEKYGTGIETGFSDSHPLQILQDTASNAAQGAAPGVGQMAGDKLASYAPAAGQVVGQGVQDLSSGVGINPQDSASMGRDSQNYTTNELRGTARNMGHDVGNALTNYAAKFHSNWKPSPMGYADGGMVGGPENIPYMNPVAPIRHRQFDNFPPVNGQPSKYQGFYQMQGGIPREQAPIAPAYGYSAV